MAARRGSLGKGVKGLGASTLSEEEETTAEELCNAAASVFQFYPLASLLGPELASLFEAAGAACGVHPGAVLPALLALIATFITPYASVRVRAARSAPAGHGCRRPLSHAATAPA